MISERVKSQKELFDELTAGGFEATGETTGTGTFWRHDTTGCHLLVPFSVQGFYPRWLTDDMFEQMSRIKGKH